VSPVSRSVVTGEWYAVLGDDVVVLLPPTAKDRVSAIWERVDEGAGFDEVLDALISRGLRDLPAFVVVSRGGDGGVRVVVRGAGHAELTTAEGPVTVEGTADTTWVERNLSGVTGLRVRVGDSTAQPYVVGPGLVRVAEVREAAAQETSAAEEPPAAEEQAQPVPEPPPVVPPPIVPEVETVDVSTGAFEPVAFAPAPPPDVVPLAPVAPPPPPPPDPTPPASRPVARLVISSGPVVDVDRVVIVGRAPQARRPGDAQARLVAVPSPHQEISSTHVEFRPGTGPDQGSAVVTDLGSTNGTVVVQPGLRPEDLQPGISVQLNPGAIVDLGEGLTIQVAPPD
jgi:hypothetical protein